MGTRVLRRFSPELDRWALPPKCGIFANAPRLLARPWFCRLCSSPSYWCSQYFASGHLKEGGAVQAPSFTPCKIGK